MKLLSALTALTLSLSAVHAEDQWLTFPGGDGPGKGKSIVLLSGDEEYRSEEVMPMLAKILSQHHGFKTTVLFSINKAGEIDPNTNNNEPGMEALDSADLVITSLRFRNWPDDQMKHFDDYYKAGKPFIALRTSTHAFQIPKGGTYAKYTWNGGEPWKNGFGRYVLGETWVAHHGAHMSEGTRGIVEDGAKDFPVLKGVEGIFGDTDVYTANPAPDVKILMRGEVTKSLDPNSPAVEGKKNDPKQPILWYREHKNDEGKTNKVICTTMGAATDLENEGLRRVIVNSAYFLTGLEVPAKADVSLVGEYKASKYKGNGFKKGVKPADLK